MAAPVVAAINRTGARKRVRLSMTIAEARTKAFAALALAEVRQAAAEKALREVYEGFWTGTLIPGLRNATLHVSNADAYPMRLN